MSLILAGEVPPLQAASPEPSMVRRLLLRAQAADAGERADAASALASAYRYGGLSAELRREATIGLTALLDDSSVLVRRALAEALASAFEAPHHVILALANDQPEIAAIVIARSPVLTDSDLVDCAACGGEEAQMALARRPNLTAGAAAALAEIGPREVVVALLDNPEAVLTESGLRRIAERFGEDGETREKLLGRPWLPATLRCDLVEAAARALSPLAAAFGLAEPRIEKIMREAREEGAAAVASAVEGRDLAGLVRHLRETGGLNAALLMRGLVSGDQIFFVTAAAELSGFPLARVLSFARAPLGAGFAALYRRTGLPKSYFKPFRAALAALAPRRDLAPGRVLRPVAQYAIAACDKAGGPDADRLLALLRRLETEAALEEARAFAAQIAVEATEPDPTPRYTPEPAADAFYSMPPLIVVNGLGDIDLLPPAIEALPVVVAEAA